MLSVIAPRFDQTSGILRHTERLVTVASFRTWRGSRTSVAQNPKSDMLRLLKRASALCKCSSMVARTAMRVDRIERHYAGSGNYQSEGSRLFEPHRWAHRFTYRDLVQGV